MCRKTCFFVMVLTLTIGLSLLAGLVAVLAAPPLQEEGQDYIVVADDWLSKLADKYLGDVLAYPAIVYCTNLKHAEDDSYAEIVDPDLIEVGWKIYIPSAEEAAEFCNPPPTEFGCQEEEDYTSKIVRCEFREGVTDTVPFEPITVTRQQYLQLTVFGKNEITRTHFVLEINQDAYPQDSDTFTLTVKAIPTATIAANFEACQEKLEECDYPEVVGLTDDRRPIVRVDSGEYQGDWPTANPYAFSVTGIAEFAEPVTVSISVNIPDEENLQELHGIIIHHEATGENNGEGETERFLSKLSPQWAKRGYYLVTNSDSITRCCKAYADCSSGPACLKCGN